MNCRTFECLLADFQEGKLAPEIRKEAMQHLSGCLSCRNLLDIARGCLDVMPDEESRELARMILSRTSGYPCHSNRELLCDYVDHTLEREDAKLVAQHLVHCQECSSLSDNLFELKGVLPGMAEIEPKAGFAESVMHATAGKKCIPHQDWDLRFMAWWNRLLRRPRFSLEAAYVGTLVVVLFAGNPFPTMRALSVRALETAMRVLPRTEESRDPAVLHSLKKLAIDLSNCEHYFRATIDHARRRSESVVAGSVNYQIRSIRTYWRKFEESLRSSWKYLRDGTLWRRWKRAGR